MDSAPKSSVRSAVETCRLRFKMKCRSICCNPPIARKYVVEEVPRGKKGYLTIFHDYERGYAEPEAEVSADRGLQSILAVEEKYGISASYNTVGMICETHSDSVKQIYERRHDIALHSYLHEAPIETPYFRLRKSVNQGRKALEKLDITVSGFRSPRSAWSVGLLRILLREGFNWNAESDSSRYPYFLARRNSRILRIPVTSDDWLYMSKNMKPSLFLEHLKSHVDRCINEKSYLALGFHPWVQGISQERLDVFERFISYITELEDIEILNFAQVYEWCVSCYHV